MDLAGDVYVADWGFHRIRKIAANGIISTLAGNGDGAFAGDGAAATSASLRYPQSVCVSAAGTVYIADTGNRRIRKVQGGVISTVAGNGNAAAGTDGVQATSSALNDPQDVCVDTDGTLYIADAANHRVRKVAVDGTITTVAGTGVAGFSGDGGEATSAQLFYPYDVEVSNGFLYIVDLGNRRVRKVTL